MPTIPDWLSYHENVEHMILHHIEGQELACDVLTYIILILRAGSSFPGLQRGKPKLGTYKLLRTKEFVSGRDWFKFKSIGF